MTGHKGNVIMLKHLAHRECHPQGAVMYGLAVSVFLEQPVGHTLSASQVETYRLCKRKWGFVYLAGLRTEGNSAAELGKRVHTVLENYLNTGVVDYTDKEASDIAADSLTVQPEPHSVKTEAAFAFTSIRPTGDFITWRGYKDAERLGSVWDHKTTGNLAYAKTSEDLLTDVQATIYAVDQFIKNPTLTAVALQWTYMRTKGAKKTVPVLATREPVEAEAAFRTIEVTGEEICKAYEKALDVPDPEAYVLKNLEPTPEACSAFGGCPFQGKCNLSPKEKIRSIMPSDFLAKLRLKQAANPEPVSKTAETIPAPPSINPPGEVPVLVTLAEPKKTKGFTLLLDCAPDKDAKAVTFEHVVDAARALIKTRHGVSDYRLIDFKGAGVLAETVSEVLEDLKPSVLVVRHSSTPEALACRSILESKAGSAIRGTR